MRVKDTRFVQVTRDGKWILAKPLLCYPLHHYFRESIMGKEVNDLRNIVCLSLCVYVICMFLCVCVGVDFQDLSRVLPS